MREWWWSDSDRIRQEPLSLIHQEVRVGYAFGVGREAPVFTLGTTDGTSVSLAAYRGDWFPILVFIPGGCEQAEVLLDALNSAASRLWGLRGQLLAICSSSPADAERPRASTSISFPLLRDDGGLAASYGIRFSGGKRVPAAFIIDRAGKIVWSAEGADALNPQLIEAALRDVAR